MLQKGKETKSIVLLAGLSNKDDFEEASSLFKYSIQELGFQFPPKSTLLIHYAKTIAKSIISGDMQPNEGCKIIGDINRALDWPVELVYFGLLSHDQTNHEDIGITEESIRPEIIEAAKELLKG